MQRFPNRSYHRYLNMIIHIQEISVGISADSYKYGLLEQVLYDQTLQNSTFRKWKFHAKKIEILRSKIEILRSEKCKLRIQKLI